MTESVKDSLSAMSGFVEKCSNAKFSGQVVFTLHFRNGGIGRTQVKTDQDLKHTACRERPEDARIRNG
jgi:hypothetical protein